MERRDTHVVMLLSQNRQRRGMYVVMRLSQKQKRCTWHVGWDCLPEHRLSLQLSIFNPYSKMESKSEVNDIISTNRKRKHDSGDSDFDEIVFPLRNRRIILSDDEEECINEDREINLISNEWI
ncbi:hypothetical protein AVEN_206762-1 [Araneus ventricosus]|uniref:Uncharacterized protein n=1 Tax=Araneus ventricosus TaxID=182803 RepID=A0A4Y2C4M1_ARAVE|nr:hypothetical protein AVEN_206762-1 [Araneus ventricosus]